MKRWLSGLLAALALFTLAACGAPQESPSAPLPDGSSPEDSVYIPAVPEEDTEDPSEGTSPNAPESGDFSITENPETGELTLSGAGSNETNADLPEYVEAMPESGKQGNASGDNSAAEDPLPENGSYTTKEDVALYLHTYGHLPDNFITKKEAQNLGWSGGSLEPYAPGMCIGGSRFGNYEGLLPEASGRSYTECDIDTLGAGSRGAKRIVFSNDGLIYYTGDHYASFELLYGEE